MNLFRHDQPQEHLGRGEKILLYDLFSTGGLQSSSSWSILGHRQKDPSAKPDSAETR
jgi:hypothetical protein